MTAAPPPASMPPLTSMPPTAAETSRTGTPATPDQAVTRWRKRPVITESVPWTGGNFDDIRAFAVAADGAECFRWQDRALELWNDQEQAWIPCPAGHHVMRGVLGEFYPVSPAVLRESFDQADTRDGAAPGHMMVMRGTIALRDAEIEQLRRGCGVHPGVPGYEHQECGFHWHGKEGADVPLDANGEPVCPRCELTRLSQSQERLAGLRALVWDMLGTLPPGKQALGFAVRAGQLGVTDEQGRPLAMACAPGPHPFAPSLRDAIDAQTLIDSPGADL